MKKRQIVANRMKEFEEKGCFNKPQLYEIKRGIEKKLNVDLYAKPELTSRQMNSIRRELLGKPPKVFTK